VWFPAIRSGSGVDVFTERLATGLRHLGLRAEITWLPHRAEYAPWTVPRPKPPRWANIVHVNTCLHRYLLPHNLPLVATIHHCVQDPALVPYKTPFQSLYHRLWVTPMERHVVANVERLVAVSRYTADRAETVFGRRDIEVIYNGVDTVLFHPNPNREPHHPFRLVFVGNPTRRKGGDLLPAIMGRLGPDFMLYFTSGLGGRRAARDRPANMILLERINDTAGMVKLYQDADALLFPSRLEGFGLAALEAQACGIPVVATRGSALPEVIEDRQSGILCAQDDVAAFAEAARMFADNPTLWRRMGTTARQRVECRFAESAFVQHYVQVYTIALSNS